MTLSLPHPFRHALLFCLALLLLAPCGCHHRQGPSAGVAGGSGAPSQADPGGARFVNVAASSGLNYRWTLPAKRPLTILQTIGNGCAFLDYDNDGNLDALLVGPDHVALYKGDGHGHFTDVSRPMGVDRLRGFFTGVAVGDYDNDGYDDVYLSGHGTGALLHNEGGRGFRDVTAASGLKLQPWGTSCAWADVDNDGRLDLYVCNYVQFGPGTVPQFCPESGQQTACNPRYYHPLRGVVYHNLGGGRFTDVTAAWGARAATGDALGVAAADYDGSGHPGLAVANDELPGDLLHYGAGQLTNVGVASGTAYSATGNPQAGMGLDWGDYDNDGRPDLVVTTYSGEVKPIYHQEGVGLFEDRARTLGFAAATLPFLSFGVKWLDYDNDGWLDLLIASGHTSDNIAQIEPGRTFREPTLLFHNDAGQHFTDVSGQAGPDLPRPIVGRGLAVGDYDNDGREDALVVDLDGAPLLLHNESAPVGHWLSLRLVGTRSNRDGIGATVTFQMGARRLTRLCHTDGSFLSASDKRVHVGLGAATAADVTVRWPSGQVDRHTDVKADQIVTAREGVAGLTSSGAGL